MLVNPTFKIIRHPDVYCPGFIRHYINVIVAHKNLTATPRFIRRCAPQNDSAPYCLNAPTPGKMAFLPSSSSILSSRLYLAVRSERQGAPVLIKPVPSAAERSAIVVSSVSPLRWLMMDFHPALW